MKVSISCDVRVLAEEGGVAFEVERLMDIKLHLDLFGERKVGLSSCYGRLYCGLWYTVILYCPQHPSQKW